MKVFVFAHDSSLYGASMSLITIIERLKADKKIDFFVLLPYNGEIEAKLTEMNVKYKVLAFPRNVIVNKHYSTFRIEREKIVYYFNKEIIKNKIRQQIKNFNPDIIYTNTSVVSVGAELGKEFKIPHVWHIREFGTLDYNLKYLPSTNNVISKIQNSNKVIFVSNAVKNHWKGLNKNSIVVYNGIYDFIKKPKSKSLEFGNVLQIAMLGVITRGKGQDVAIKALSLLKVKLPNFKFTIYGGVLDSTYSHELQQLIIENNCENHIVISPFVSNTSSIYKSLSILLSCSQNEGFGRTIIEAMSLGIPVIANNSGGPTEIITHLKDGILYEHTPESLATQIETLMSNKNLYESISRNAIETAHSKFGVEKYVNSVYGVFESTISKSNP